jgi:hypothetical protein
MNEVEAERREAVMVVARRQVGQQEQPRGSNWGGTIPQYLASVGINSPAPWCAAFVYYCFEHAHDVVNILPRTGYTPLIHRWVKANKRIITAQQAQKADLVLFWFPALKRVAHVGIVGKITPSDVWTIEGNTNDEGSREGYEVARRKRKLTRHMIFVRMMP